MSKLGELDRSMSNLPDILMGYEGELERVMSIIQIQGKTLESAQREQCAWLAYYDERRVELKSLVKFMTAQVAKVRGSLVRKYNEAHSRSLGERMINSYIDAEPEYLSMYELLVEVEELYEKYTAVVEAFTKRGYALRDLTTARVNDIHNTLI